GEQPRDQGAVADVAMHEHVVRVTLQRGQGVEVAGVGQRIEVDHLDAARHGLQNEVAANETGPAGHEPDWHMLLLISVVTDAETSLADSRTAKESAAK